MIKRWLLLALIVWVGVSVNAQSWTKNLPEEKSKDQFTLTDYQQAFNDFWNDYNVKAGYYLNNGVQTKARGWKQFKRWEYYMESQINPSTGAFPETNALKRFHDFTSKTTAKSGGSGNWTFLGTSTSEGGYAGIGRINCVAFHPSDLDTYWVGSPSGGLWVTHNDGNTWDCLTDDNPLLGVSDIIIPNDYETSQTIYIATGDKDHWDNNSIGVLKSTDGGLTWNTTGLTFSPADHQMVNRLLIQPSNTDVLLAATSQGIYKTIDAANTWTQISTLDFIDLEYMDDDFTTLFGGTTNGKFYMSQNGGDSWTIKIDETGQGRVEIDYYPGGWSSHVWLVMANEDNGLHAVYYYNVSNDTYGSYGSQENLLGWSAGGYDEDNGESQYNLALAVDYYIVVGGINTWRAVTNPNGNSWDLANHWIGDGGVQEVHCHKHMLKYRSNHDLFECNDGGLYLSTDYGETWVDKTNGMGISQMYRLGVSANNSNEVITGLQDNGTKLQFGGNWWDVIGGDGMECLIDYTNNNIQYGTSENGQIYRTTDHWENMEEITPNNNPDGAWVTPYVIDPVDPQVLYIGYNDVYKTTNRGDSWMQITSFNSDTKLHSLAIAPSDNQVIYAADYQQIYKTSNNGLSWAVISDGLPTDVANIKYICVKNDDPNTVWIAMSGYDSPGIYQTVDGGDTWESISAGLPALPVNTVVQNKQNTEETELYCGTDVGVYRKRGDADWMLFNNGLPNVKVSELEIYYDSNASETKLRAATYGRGLWETQLEPLNLSLVNTSQNNTDSVYTHSVNQEIIGVQIELTGSGVPIELTQMQYSTSGSTDSETDILTATVYYTGNSPDFDLTDIVGNEYINPSGEFTISCNQTLTEGTHYFWLTYNLSPNAQPGNLVDAACLNVTIDGNDYIPNQTDPDGSREIEAVQNQCEENSLASNTLLTDSLPQVSDVLSNQSVAASYIGAQGLIQEVDIWMMLVNSNGEPWQACEGIEVLPVNVRFCENNFGQMEDTLYEFLNLDGNISFSGLMWNAETDAIPVYKMSIELPEDVDLQNGFLSVQSSLSAPDDTCKLVWIASEDNFGSAYVFNNEWHNAGINYSYCLQGVSDDCQGPNEILVDEITNTSIELSWEEIPGVEFWDISYGPLGASPDDNSQIAGIADNQIIIGGLEPATEYYIYLKSHCGVGESSMWSGPFQATTLESISYCQDFEVQISSETASEYATGFSVCQGETVSFFAECNFVNNNSDYTQTTEQIHFTWELIRLGVDTLTMQGWGTDSLQYTFDTSGGYVLSVHVHDQYLCNGNGVDKVPIWVSLAPDISEIYADSPVCEGMPFILAGNIETTDWEYCSQHTYFPQINDTIYINDAILGTDEVGVDTDTCFEFTDFPTGAVLNDASDILGIHLNIEHSYLGDLDVKLTCPNGQSVLLKEWGSSANATYLGEPVDVQGNLTPGSGYSYTFTEYNPQYGTWNQEALQYTYSYTDNIGTYYSSRYYLPPGTYTPENSLEALEGCPLNGFWCFTFTDHMTHDDGYVFSLGVELNTDLYQDTCWHINSQYQTEWTGNGIFDTGADDGDGEAIPEISGELPYVFSVSDDFGCVYDTTLNILVLPVSDPACCELPEANAGTNQLVAGTCTFFDATWYNGANTGSWEQIQGPGVAVIDDEDMVNSEVCVSEYGTYIFVWTEFYQYSTMCFDSDTVEITFIEPDHFHTKTDNFEVKVYPSPVKDVLFVESALEFNKIQLYDSSGKIVYESSEITKNMEIDMNTFPSQYYFINIYYNKEIIVRKQFVKE